MKSIRLMTTLFLLVSQLLPCSAIGFAADATLNPATGTVAPTVDATTTPTSSGTTPSNSQTQTSTDFMGQKTTLSKDPVALQTIQSAPEGWTETSNSSYVWRTDRVGTNIEYLKLQDLRTGTTYNLGNVYGTFTDKLDVSQDDTPGGPVVIFERYLVSSSSGPRPYITYIKRISNLSESIQIQDPLSSRQGILQMPISFSSDKATIKLHSSFSDGTKIENTYGVDLANLTVTSQTAKIVDQGTNLHIDSDTSLVILPTSSYQTGIKVLIWDATDQSQMIPLSPITIASAGVSNVSFGLVDAYTTPAGRQVVSVGVKYTLSGTVYRRTLLQDARTGKKFSLPVSGMAISVSYNGNFATYTLRKADGSTRRYTVDLDTF